MDGVQIGRPTSYSPGGKWPTQVATTPSDDEMDFDTACDDCTESMARDSVEVRYRDSSASTGPDSSASMSQDASDSGCEVRDLQSSQIEQRSYGVPPLWVPEGVPGGQEGGQWPFLASQRTAGNSGNCGVGFVPQAIVSLSDQEKKQANDLIKLLNNFLGRLFQVTSERQTRKNNPNWGLIFYGTTGANEAKGLVASVENGIEGFNESFRVNHPELEDDCLTPPNLQAFKEALDNETKLVFSPKKQITSFVHGWQEVYNEDASQTMATVDLLKEEVKKLIGSLNNLVGGRALSPLSPSPRPGPDFQNLSVSQGFQGLRSSTGYASDGSVNPSTQGKESGRKHWWDRFHGLSAFLTPSNSPNASKEPSPRDDESTEQLSPSPESKPIGKARKRLAGRVRPRRSSSMDAGWSLPGNGEESKVPAHDGRNQGISVSQGNGPRRRSVHSTRLAHVRHKRENSRP